MTRGSLAQVGAGAGDAVPCEHLGTMPIILRRSENRAPASGSSTGPSARRWRSPYAFLRTVIVVTAARLAGGKPVGQRRLLYASVAYSVGFAATYTGVGVGIHDLLRVI